MDWRLHGLLYGLLIAIGVAGGFYFATALQKQIEALIGAAVVIGFLTWLGSGADLLGLLREWFKEKREEERIPQLVFDGFTRSDELFMSGATELHKYTYFVRVRKTAGDGYAEQCEGFLTVNGTNISNAPTVGAHANVRRYDIGGRMDLRLFTIDGNDIIFPSAHLSEGLYAKYQSVHRVRRSKSGCRNSFTTG
jgi:hypothetical protein